LPIEQGEDDFNFSGMLDQYTLEKDDPELFSFWVNNIFAEKQVLFDICGLMQSRRSSYQSD